MTSSSAELVPNIDAYGTLGRSTYLADFVEYQTLLGERLPLSGLADLVRERNWGRRDLDLVNPSTTFEEWEAEAIPSKFDDDDGDVVARVEQILFDRQNHLGSAYPFQLTGYGMSAVLKTKGANAVRESGLGYLGILSITLAHAYAVSVPGLTAATVEDSFEEYVVSVFQRGGIPAVVVPTYGAMATKLPKIAAPLGLHPKVSLASFSTRAKDGGTDILCHLPTTDPRKYPLFLILGQVTCGKTETWESKAKSPNSNAWRRMLQMEWDPMQFLAVPHHVDSRHWPLVAQEGGAAIVDRISLVSMSNEPTPDGLVVAQHILDINRRFPTAKSDLKADNGLFL